MEVKELRLIDANALWDKCNNELWYNNADRDEVALLLIDNAPTVDAVEVVRCGNCKHFDLRSDGRSMYYCCKHNHPVNDSDYCSDGKK